MNFLEKDLEEIIFTSDRSELSQRGLCLDGTLLRQVRIGNYGIADLIEIKRPMYHQYFKKHEKGLISIYELKLDKASPSSFLQAVRYAKGVHSYLGKKELWKLFDIEIVLIGKRVDTQSSFVYLSDLFGRDMCNKFIGDDISTFVSIYNYKYDVNGLMFNQHFGYRQKNEGF
jgi:hypothetical protein